MSPAVENKRSTSVDVGGGVRNFLAMAAKDSLTLLDEFFSYSFQKPKHDDDRGESVYSSRTSFAFLEEDFSLVSFVDCLTIDFIM